MFGIVRMSALVLLAAGATQAQAPATAPPAPPTRLDSLFSAGKYAEARAGYEAFLKDNPASLQARLRAGWAALRLKQADVALAYFDSVVAKVPQGRAPVALAGRGIAWALKGRRTEALRDLQRADSAGLVNFEALDTEEGLKNLRADPDFVALRERVQLRAWPCGADPHAREFDFWIGDWDAYPNGGSQMAGKSTILRASGGCMILENWTTVLLPWGAPYEGKSMNFVDPATGKWRQVWMGAGGDMRYFEAGEFREGAMRFTYSRTTPQGQAVSGHFVFYNLGPNLVRQFQDMSTDGGKTYQTVYDFLYVRRGSGQRPVLTGQ